MKATSDTTRSHYAVVNNAMQQSSYRRGQLCSGRWAIPVAAADQKRIDTDIFVLRGKHGREPKTVSFDQTDYPLMGITYLCSMLAFVSRRTHSWRLLLQELCVFETGVLNGAGGLP